MVATFPILYSKGRDRTNRGDAPEALTINRALGGAPAAERPPGTALENGRAASHMGIAANLCGWLAIMPYQPISKQLSRCSAKPESRSTSQN